MALHHARRRCASRRLPVALSRSVCAGDAEAAAGGECVGARGGGGHRQHSAAPSGGGGQPGDDTRPASGSHLPRKNALRGHIQAPLAPRGRHTLVQSNLLLSNFRPRLLTASLRLGSRFAPLSVRAPSSRANKRAHA
eukprot:6469923-Pyramimonas_sp.AAC.1